ncbi:MAG: carbohydrate kinase family protein [Patescibacteria group bacterium]
MKEHQFIAIGDTATDVFIRLEDDSGAKVSGTPDSPEYRISLPFAAKIPYESAITLPGVGNAPNASVAAAKLGLHSSLVAHVGDDEPGKETIAVLEAQGVDTRFVLPEAGRHTNYSYILWYKEERTILRKHEDFSYALPDIGTPGWVYFSAVGAGANKFYDDFAAYAESHPEVKFAFQPGGNEISLGTTLRRFYDRADIFFCNVEEAGTILGITTLGTKELLKRMHDLGPKIVVITDGPNGAHAYDGNQMINVPVYPDGLNAKERTGAGDAFASTTTAALALGKDLSTALTWGAVNSASVVQYVGAQQGLLSISEIESRLSKAPNFKPVILE